MHRLLPLLLALATAPAWAAPPEEPAADLQPGGAAGERAPDFTATDHTGKQVSLAGLRAKGPVVLVFYRGYW